MLDNRRGFLGKLAGLLGGGTAAPLLKELPLTAAKPVVAAFPVIVQTSARAMPVSYAAAVGSININWHQHMSVNEVRSAMGMRSVPDGFPLYPLEWADR